MHACYIATLPRGDDRSFVSLSPSVYICIYTFTMHVCIHACMRRKDRVIAEQFCEGTGRFNVVFWKDYASGVRCRAWEFRICVHEDLMSRGIVTEETPILFVLWRTGKRMRGNCVLSRGHKERRSILPYSHHYCYRDIREFFHAKPQPEAPCTGLAESSRCGNDRFLACVEYAPPIHVPPACHIYIYIHIYIYVATAQDYVFGSIVIYYRVKLTCGLCNAQYVILQISMI